ncbi:hypothetical protein [Peribacillus butanolivorans]|uniref:hypothetical protein n=1 Tax=Peribacillus butanolivorans TaxID=421767 RepID=UPI00366CF0C8
MSSTILSYRKNQPREHKGFIKGFEIHGAFKSIWFLPKVGIIPLENIKMGVAELANVSQSPVSRVFTLGSNESAPQIGNAL